MRVHLVDGTYELFRAFYAPAAARGSAPSSAFDATRQMLRTLLALLEPGRVDGGATHAAVAFDTVIESFRNDLFPGYKTGEGIDPALFAQFPLAERASRALGLVTWSMIEFEADDALAAAASRYAEDASVEQILVCSPDKDLAQCVVGSRIVLLDRRRKTTLDEDGVRAKYGVSPASIPDYLALVGDTADGIPGVPRWGEKSAGAILSRFGRLEDIPPDPKSWGVPIRGADALAASLREHRDVVMLYRTLATLRRDVPLAESVSDLAWRGADRTELEALLAEIGEPELLARVPRFR